MWKTNSASFSSIFLVSLLLSFNVQAEVKGRLLLDSIFLGCSEDDTEEFTVGELFNKMDLFTASSEERGDYQESWQPMVMDAIHLKEAEEIANKVTKALGGSGMWGVEFFIGKEGVYFSELSPRPHDTSRVRE